MKDFHIPAFNHNMMLRNWVGILTSEQEYVSEYQQETAGTLKGRGSLIRGLLTEVRSGSREKIGDGEVPRISSTVKPLALLSLKGPGEVK